MFLKILIGIFVYALLGAAFAGFLLAKYGDEYVTDAETDMVIAFIAFWPLAIMGLLAFSITRKYTEEETETDDEL